MIRVVKLASLSVPLVAAAAAFWAVGLAVPAAAASHHAKASAHNVSRPLYDIAPRGHAAVNSDDPSLTGGGSLGYNQNIYNW